MDIADSVLDLIGHTPLVRLRQIGADLPCPVVAKIETTNPGGSVKDRPALTMIEAAERRGDLKPGGTIIEPTSGNTGVGLAIVAAQRGYNCIFVMTDKVGHEKVQLLRAYGAEVVVCPVAVPPEDPESYYSTAARLLRETPDAYSPNQYANPDNPAAHEATTGPEIWQQTDGRIDGFTCAIGTGGTLAGISTYLKDRNKNIITAVADPMGAAMYNFFKHGELKSEGSSITEGIGQGRITKNIEGAPIDDAYQIPDQEALPVVFDLLKHEGLCLGGSSGINVAGAMRMAKDLGPGHTIVTILCDAGNRYQSKLFNPVFLKEKGLPAPEWL